MKKIVLVSAPIVALALCLGSADIETRVGEASYIGAWTDEGRYSCHMGKPEGTTAATYQQRRRQPARLRRNMSKGTTIYYCAVLTST